ncbi:3-alpha,7-alpha,12-alpha-trihydroxy-5-beta-cholest-24-enoyl-CoA hydratase [Actinomadura sp. NBRC 104412]|uniref:MaoC/PaaZ C-terminal domain-containing protein n=1 Tax=Actinomadura sp. NBRC 104412 TaxID=3032203 RepID=UPI0024A51520|nr:MaoC/PaaZ C-terminal domain-containing protein [Actinomadura sp. NBRC 104412]GLZ08154.1 3-alpha,7-alpha,12-alpha-trihydroxy-5-beta-cholest-24-enoyl-CoA hydratase [Actinomadura sp. NBRC 104412]
MPVNIAVVGQEQQPPTTRTWDSTRAILYALGVGAGRPDPLDELVFTAEDGVGGPQLVLPTFVTVLVPWRLGGDLGDFDRGKVVHAEEEIELHAPIPVAGEAIAESRVTGMYDKRSGALIVIESKLGMSDGRPLATVRSGLFVRGEGGFGGEPGPPSPAWKKPDRPADLTVEYGTHPEQALLYRLSGDRNPLHADPAFARRAGFDRPILHGLCSYGITGRALLRGLTGGDPSRLGSMSGRMSAPVTPGDTLTVAVWREEPGRALFQTLRSDGTVVIDRGRATYAEGS